MIRPATSEEMPAVREIFREYAAWVGGEICFEAFEKELAELPGAYGLPSGGLYLAFRDNRVAGCGGFRKLASGIAEMKRLYVRPAFRGAGLGRLLVQRVADEARALGYMLLRLDTLPRMKQAIAMYQELGFRQIAPYGNNPPEALCFELTLNGHAN